MKLQNFRFHGSSGLERFFGPLEARIMSALWDAPGELTIKEVQQALNQDKAMSFNTVMTVMNRLVDKGVLSKKTASKSHRYLPVLTRDAFLEAQSKELTFELVQEFGSRAVAHMVDALEQVDPDLLEQLERQLKQHKKER
ncbi:BlaI/MecI/CopY family transcriptional regulator [Cohnella sp. JJ-181]|uniref:BlaI/MecI/CopY family transcriptional regulator n=1 Tax=Cohnella rhizoplanae TaxID=2974897 RepID=UPI0022FF5662|nr:BlaI/MecI/CopY family transcriptional regulator [Cohnella sp. JJ-181]CAI6066086.1 Transcriptional regulator BlaI [Cohnella sp. JJ-181]